MKKVLLTLIVALGLCGSIYAQGYESHWPGFDYHAFEMHGMLVAGIQIDGETITVEDARWDALEVAFFVNDVCRGNENYLTDDYVLEYGDPFPILDGASIFYDNTGEEVVVKMYDHMNGIEYDNCIVTLLGDPFTIIASDDNDQGYFDPENPVMLNFIGETPCQNFVPWDLAVNDVTAHEATLSWEGSNDNYNVRYQVYNPSVVDFEEGSIPQGWIANLSNSSSGVTQQAAHSGVYGFMFHYNEQNASLISPLLSGTEQGLGVSFYYKRYSSSYTEQFCVGYSLEDVTDPDAFTYGDIIEVSSLNWEQYQNNFPAGTQRIAIKYVYTNAFYLYIDDIEFATAASDNWVYVSDVTSPTTLEGLAPETAYEVQVQSTCGDTQSEWSESLVFTTGIACPAPTNLYFYDLTEQSVMLSWTENGTATDWDVEYGTDPEFLSFTTVNVSTTPVLALSDLTPETKYYARVKTYCGEDGYSLYSNVVDFTPTAATVIGGGSTATNGYLPTNCYYNYSLTQQIYTVAELGEAGLIQSIGFFSNATVNRTRTLDIYMVSTDKASFETQTDWIGVTDADLVYSGQVTFLGSDWTVITLNDPFIYDGMQNVAIIVDDNTGGYASNTYFKAFEAQAQALSVCSDGTNYEVAAPTYTGTIQSTKNQIRILKGEMPDCLAPRQLAATEIGSDYAVLSWNQYGDVTSWTVEVTGEYTTTWTANENPYTLQGLTAETEYSVRVSPACDPDLWSNVITFTTTPTCPAPTDLEVSNITHYTADVAWTGTSDGYNVYYRVAPGLGTPVFSEGFEGGEMPESWTTEGNGTWTVGTGDYSTSTGAHSGSYNAKIDHSTTGNTTYLVTPAMDLSEYGDVKLSFWYVNRSWAGDTDALNVYYRVNGGEWNELWSTSTAHSTWTNQVITLTGMAANYQIGFMMTDCYGYGVGLDDIVVAPEVITEWEVVENVTTNPYTLSNLVAGTDYEVKVQGICGSELSEESEVAYFTTLSENYKLFVVEGDWDIDNSWMPVGVPTIEQDVELRANATITTVAQANSINQGSYTLTIEDGGQLMHNNTGVNATVKKNITGYGQSDGNWYFIANPLTSSITPTEENGFLTGEYDFYDFNPAYNHAEWRNYRAGEFTYMYYGMYGYLYANQEGTTLNVNGTIRSSLNPQSRYVYNNSSLYVLGAWSLLGNPFVCNGYLVDSYTNGMALPFYKMNANGDGYEAVSGEPIAPMEGVFYEAENSGSVYITRNNPSALQSQLNMVVSQGRSTKDNAIVVFGESKQLSKLSFRENSTKVYVPMEGKDYAVVSVGQVGEIPVNFKAEHNGSYTMGFTSKDVEFSYLHLIDNMTGADQDLLQNPSYSFNAQTTDYASRFKLVFATGSSVDGDSFSFINGAGNLSIFGIEGEATVQVMDVLGHVLSSETFSGSYEKHLDVAPGVYMIRLIQGNDIKVQKMVIK